MSDFLNSIKYKASPNQSGLRGDATKYIVIHCCQGSYIGTINWVRQTAKNFVADFMNPQSKVSAHYVISKKGEIICMVKPENKAWHVGLANAVAIGIEHEGFCEKPGWTTPEMLEASARLCAALCRKYSLPVLAIIGHNDPIMRKQYHNDHSDPGVYFSIPLFRRAVQQVLDNQ